MKTSILLRSIFSTGLLIVSLLSKSQITTVNGNVGIKNTAPVYPLDVNGIGQFGGGAKIGNGPIGFFADGTNHGIRAFNVANSGFKVQSYSGLNTYMYVGQAGAYAGRLGIGTVTPSTIAQVSGTNAAFTITNILGGWGSTATFDMQSHPSSSPSASVHVTDDGNYSAYMFFLNKIPGADTNSLIERMRINSGGRVSIGALDTYGKFTIQNNGSYPSGNWANYYLSAAYLSEGSPGAGDHVYAFAGNSLTAAHKLIFRKAQGTLANPTLIGLRTAATSIVAAASDGSNFQPSAQIDLVTNGAGTGTGNVQTEIGFSSFGPRMKISSSGSVGIGLGPYTPAEMLSVNGNIVAKLIRVSVSSVDWPDYVFSPGYKLRPLSTVENYIKRFKHLPDVPSAAQVGKKGLDIAQNQAVLLRKIEELSLYIIDHGKQLKEIEDRTEK